MQGADGRSVAFASDPTADIALEFRAVTKRYDGGRSDAKNAVTQVSLAVQRGEVLCLMGTSGSGKSTLLRHVNRLIEPSSGDVLIDGEVLGNLTLPALRQLRSQRIGMVFQHFGLLPHRSVRDNVALPLELRGAPESERHAAAQRQLQAVGLGEWGEHFPHELSGGMQQRVGLARALVTDPEILLMDEPFSALDPTIRRDLQGRFLQLVRERGITTLLVTHDPGEALRLADRIAVLRAGRLIQVGTPGELLEHPADDGVADFFDERPHISPTAPSSEKEPVVASLASTLDEPTMHGWARQVLLGPVALASAGRNGLFWLALLVELTALAWLAGAWREGPGWTLAFALAALLVNRAASAGLSQQGHRRDSHGVGLPLALLLTSQALTLWRALTPDAAGALLQFPADRDSMLAVAGAIDRLIGWSQLTFESAFVGVIVAVRTVIEGVEGALGWIPWPVPALALVYLAWRSAGAALALTSALALGYIGLFGFWERTVSTIALVGSSVLLSLLIGIPMGILLAKRPLARRVITPLLDVMQTLPTFVYLIPAVAFFSVGKTPAVIATVIFALAPMIRLTALGIREVPKAAVEAAVAHGATSWQTLTRVELPLASSSLLLGVNQTIVMSLSMVVVAALIGAGGLGYDVMTALRNIKGGEGVLAGIAIVFCALVPDRIIQASLRKRHHPTQE
ncbi:MULTISPECIES: ATP-binding cassette domain-containing protein [unclassified Pseudomonas]|uniref:ATP-binding cassette domain-containing protein n=1 Tax=unclassified Pseudomonas TaxID=196821 RepID=UPI001CE028C1|nr:MULTISPECIES: ATP-binding cassette domain-containing protein [unclassified Pseudomonas]